MGKRKSHYSMLERIVAGVKSAARPLAIGVGIGVLSTIAACSPKGEDNHDPVSISGSATDGPYTDGSEVTIVELTAGLEPTTGTTIQWTDDLGRYTAELKNNTSYIGSISGFNFDEISGYSSTAPINLRGFFRTSFLPGEYNINDFTHITAERVKTLFSGGGLSFEEASAQARDELLAELPMIISTPSCQPYEMDIISGPSECNNSLFALELLARQYAHNKAAEEGAPVDATLQEILNYTAFSFATSGTLPLSTLDGLREAAMTADVRQATQNVADYFAAHGDTATPPNADEVLDSDEDGEVNLTDPSPRDPNTYTGHCDNDSDGHEAVSCGGDDCDDQCDTCYPGSAESCGEFLDHDCDGLVDELEGCDSCTAGTPSIISVSDANTAQSLFVSGTEAYVATEGGVASFDVSTPSSPVNEGMFNGPGPGVLTMLNPNTVLWAVSGGFYVIDVSDPASPSLLGGPISSEMDNPRSVFVSSSGQLAYIAACDGIRAVDVSDPSDPRVVAGPLEEGLMNCVNNLFERNGIIYEADNTGLYLMKYSSGSGLEVISSLPGVRCADVFARDDYLFLATDSGVQVADVSDPLSPSIVGSTVLSGFINSLFISGENLYALSEDSLSVIDISTPTSPSFMSAIPVGGVDQHNTDVFVLGNHAYVTGHEAGEGKLYIIDLDCMY